MKLRELLMDADVISVRCDIEMEIDDICYDSRKAGPGMAFVASRRIGADGHDFIEDAVEQKSAVIIAEREIPDYPCVVVKDGNIALAEMSANIAGRPADKLQIIGVTGTKGKTTTTFMIKSILEKALGAKVGLIGTIENMIGSEALPTKNTTPEAPELHKLFRKMVDAGCTYAVMEVSSHSLAIDRVGGIGFKVGVFTNFSQDHLDYHKTMENYLKAKAKLLDMSEWGVINLDDEVSEYLMKNTKCKKYTISTTNINADLTAKNIRYRDEQGMSFEALIEGEIFRIYLATPGIFTVYNALCATAASLLLGVPLADAAKALGETEGVRGRVEVVPTNTEYKVIVDYAHSPASVESVIGAVKEFTPGKIISILGCGGERDRTKRPLMASAAVKQSGYVILTTDNPRGEEPQAIIDEMLPGISGTKIPFEVIVDRRKAIYRALSIARKGDTVLIMGKGHETYQEIKGVRNHFDDREEVLAYYTTKQGKKKL